MFIDFLFAIFYAILTNWNSYKLISRSIFILLINQTFEKKKKDGQNEKYNLPSNLDEKMATWQVSAVRHKKKKKKKKESL